MSWQGLVELTSRPFACGYCGKVVASNLGYLHLRIQDHRIYVCPHCDGPNYFTGEAQIPGVAPGDEVEALPQDVGALYKEARDSVMVSAYTGSVLTCRKLLMNIAVAQGAAAGQSFLDCVEYLAANGYVPPTGEAWVDRIRKRGNEAAHEIVLMSRADAEQLIWFAEMLLKFIYEFPSRVPPSKP